MGRRVNRYEDTVSRDSDFEMGTRVRSQPRSSNGIPDSFCRISWKESRIRVVSSAGSKYRILRFICRGGRPSHSASYTPVVSSEPRNARFVSKSRTRLRSSVVSRFLCPIESNFEIKKSEENRTSTGKCDLRRTFFSPVTGWFE